MSAHVLLNLLNELRIRDKIQGLLYATLLRTSYRFPKVCKPLVVYRFYCMALFHFQTGHHMINIL